MNKIIHKSSLLGNTSTSLGSDHDIDMLALTNNNEFVQYNTHELILHRHVIRISNDIVDPHYYTHAFNLLANASQNDVIEIIINSGGGDMWTFIQFYSAIQQCDATITTQMEGCVGSAAALLFLCGDKMIIGPASCMMLHNYSTWGGGKGHEVIARVNFMSNHLQNVTRGILERVLSIEEVDKLIDGKDYWFDCKTVVERLEKFMPKTCEVCGETQCICEPKSTEVEKIKEMPKKPRKPRKKAVSKTNKKGKVS